MSLGLILRVSWIFLLFDCSAGLPVKEHGYRYTADSRNQVEVQDDDYDDDQDDTLNSENSDQSDWKTSTNQLIFLDDTRYSKPSVAQWPGLVPSLQNLHNTQSSGAVQRLVTGRPREGSLDDPVKELLFPFSSNYPQRAPVRHQPGPVPTRYPSGNTRRSSNTAGWHSNANYMGTGSSPSSTQQGSFPSNPTDVGAQDFYPSRLGSPSSGFYGGENNPNFRQINYRPQTPVVSTQKVVITQKVSEPSRPPLPLSSYIIQSRNGYQRARYHQSKSRYSPDV